MTFGRSTATPTRSKSRESLNRDSVEFVHDVLNESTRGRPPISVPTRARPLGMTHPETTTAPRNILQCTAERIPSPQSGGGNDVVTVLAHRFHDEMFERRAVHDEPLHLTPIVLVVNMFSGRHAEHFLLRVLYGTRDASLSCSNVVTDGKAFHIYRFMSNTGETNTVYFDGTMYHDLF